MNVKGVMIGSDNPKALGEFYTKVLGEPGWHQDDWYGWDGLMIGAHSEVKGNNDTPARMMIMIEADDVKAEFERIKALDAKVVAEPYQPGKNNDEMWLSTFADPDGNYFQVASPWKG